MGMTKLIVPDAHVYPGDDMRRFHALAKFIGKRRPEVIIVGGDFWDMQSFCAYNSALEDEGARYSEDFLCGHTALDIMEQCIGKKSRIKRYILEGNHEWRVSRYLHKHPKMIGTISEEGFARPGWTRVPYEGKHPGRLVIDDIVFRHYFTTRCGREFSGRYPARTILADAHVNCITFHHHIRDFAEMTREDGVRIRAWSAGCFVDPDTWMGYAGPYQRHWWSGVMFMHGDMDEEWISTKRLLREYGG